MQGLGCSIIYHPTVSTNQLQLLSLMRYNNLIAFSPSCSNWLHFGIFARIQGSSFLFPLLSELAERPEQVKRFHNFVKLVVADCIINVVLGRP